MSGSDGLRSPKDDAEVACEAGVEIRGLPVI